MWSPCSAGSFATDGLVRPIGVVVTRGDEPGPTIGGPPPERGVQVGSIMFDGRDATLISGHLKPADRRIDAPPLPRISGAQGGYAFEKARPKNIEKWDL
jgi:hypothetical protein